MRLDCKILNRGVASSEYLLMEGRGSWGKRRHQARVQSLELWPGGGAMTTKMGTD